MIELLLALGLLSILLTGMADTALDLRRFGHELEQQRRAQWLAEDWHARVRLSGAGVDPFLWAGPAPAPVPVAVDCAAGPCGAEELAQWELAAWLQRLAGRYSEVIHGGAARPGPPLAEPSVCSRLEGTELRLAIGWRGAVPQPAAAPLECAGRPGERRHFVSRAAPGGLR